MEKPVNEQPMNASSDGQPLYGAPNSQPPQYGPESAQVKGQPTMNAGPSQWTSGLHGCCSDCFSCCLTCWLPCVAFGQIAGIVDDDYKSACLLNGLIYTGALFLGVPCCYSCLYRRKMRAKFQLPEEPCNDFCTHCWCEPCALCQEYRELQNRGFDPTLASTQPGSNMTAPTPPMMR